jgi:hypothetical protein
MTDLTPEKLVVARAIDVLTSLSPRNLSKLRRGIDPSATSEVYRFRLRALAQAIDVAYPGVLDETLRVIAAETPKDPS